MNFDTHILFRLLIFFCIMYKVNSSSRDGSESYMLSCGASSPASDANGRRWDSDSKFIASSDNTITDTAQTQDPLLPSPVPYMTARIFKSEYTYKFSISSTSRHWIRLHFYPPPYSKFNVSNSYFSVTCSGGFTLLNNFSASITAQAPIQSYIMREFSLIPIKSGILDLTFTPSSLENGSYAFVNGIEVIPMPEIFQSTQSVEFSDQTFDVENYVLGTMFRLNVGGQYIPPDYDSALTRTWYDDSQYIYSAAYGVSSQADSQMKISYTSTVPNYTAPIEVYSTARSMGPDPGVNAASNLTWVFSVDANFTYLLRLHFCEYQLSKINQRVFTIFINNKTAFPNADVIAWSGGKGVPVYKDFATYVSGNYGHNELWVTLHPSESVKPEYMDVILNGMEIFKMNDPNKNLAGPNPEPSPLLLRDEFHGSSFAKSKSDKLGIIIGLISAVLGSFALVAAAICFLKNRKAKGEKTSWLPMYSSYKSSATKNSGVSCSSSYTSNLSNSICRHFTLKEIKQGTKNFDESQVIGVGGFGKVYKGIIDGGTKVAIKRANPSSQQGIHEFQTEIDLLSKLRHRHLVSLVGACEEDNEMILVYDYMANGTLREHLYGTNNNKPSLSWKQRLEICIGAARGLHYLHTGAKYTIIHRDVKTTNILLDAKWVAKVSDFGLSKTGPNIDQSHVSTVVKGSFGYLDPEYFRRQKLTDKSDVYSFGVVLFEVLSGRPALNPSLPKEQVSLADWVIKCYRGGTIEDMVDPLIKREITSECLQSFMETAFKCLSDQGTDRPKMGNVLWSLEFARQLQSNPDRPKFVAEEKANDAYAMHTNMLNTEKEGDACKDTENSSNKMFSQILNPKGR